MTSWYNNPVSNSILANKGVAISKLHDGIYLYQQDTDQDLDMIKDNQ